MSQNEQQTTIKAYLRPIDRDGLIAFAQRGRENPDRRGTNVVHTVCEGQYRTLSFVGEHDPVVVDEPLHLFGQDTAPAPGEIVLSGLGGCLAVGITAVATFRNVRLSRLELHIEGDVGNTAAWGAGGATREPSQMGFQAIRVKVDVEGDATREELDEIVRQANYFSPVANSMRNPIPLEVSLS
ncbi:OsmC family protein [Neorhizobium sp. LMR1-1-1.1]